MPKPTLMRQPRNVSKSKGILQILTEKLTEFLEINYHDSCGLFCASPEAFIQQVLQLRTKDKKPPSHHKNINDSDNEDDKLMPLTIKRKMD